MEQWNYSCKRNYIGYIQYKVIDEKMNKLPKI